MRVMQIQLNRAAVLNALNRACLKEIHSALDAAQKDLEISLLLIIGSGDRAFSVGADLSDLATLITLGDRKGVKEYSRLFESLFERLESSKILSMAAINGAAVGTGAELALACDIRLFSTKGYFAFPETSLGLISPTHRLTRARVAFASISRSARTMNSSRFIRLFPWSLTRPIRSRLTCAAGISPLTAGRVCA